MRLPECTVRATGKEQENRSQPEADFKNGFGAEPQMGGVPRTRRDCATGGHLGLAPSSRPKSPRATDTELGRRSRRWHAGGAKRRETSSPQRLPWVGWKHQSECAGAEPGARQWKGGTSAVGRGTTRNVTAHTRDSTCNPRQSRRRHSPLPRNGGTENAYKLPRFPGEWRQSDEGARQSKFRTERAILTGGLRAAVSPFGTVAMTDSA